MRLAETRSMIAVLVASLVLVATPVGAQDVETAAAAEAKPLTDEDYDELFQRFLEVARQQGTATETSVDYSWMSDLALDVRARRVNDIVTVRVIESISGSGAADSAVSQGGSGVASLSNFFGLENRFPASIDPTNLVEYPDSDRLRRWGSDESHRDAERHGDDASVRGAAERRPCP